VDWEERFDPQRMVRERLRRAKNALAESELDLLFVFRPEDARYRTGYRHHLGPAFILGNAVVVLAKGGEPVLWTMDHVHCKQRMTWMDESQIQARANFRLLQRVLRRPHAGVRMWQCHANNRAATGPPEGV